MFDFASLYQATSVDDAVSALEKDPEALVIAGGTDVLIKIREGELQGCRLVSIHGLSELAGVTLDKEGTLHLGALTTFHGVSGSELVRRLVPFLGEAVDQAGGPQLREMGTIGGNVCNGVTSADSASTLMALDAVLRVRGPEGQRDIPISEWYKGVGRVALRHGELLTGILIPEDRYRGFSGHYIKYAQRSAMDIATLGTSVNVRLSEDKKTVERCRIAFGVAGPVPMRAEHAEAAANDRPLSMDLAEEFARAVLEDINPRDSWRASKAFRQHIAVESARRAFVESARLAGGVL